MGIFRTVCRFFVQCVVRPLNTILQGLSPEEELGLITTSPSRTGDKPGGQPKAKRAGTRDTTGDKLQHAFTGSCREHGWGLACVVALGQRLMSPGWAVWGPGPWAGVWRCPGWGCAGQTRPVSVPGAPLLSPWQHGAAISWRTQWSQF